MKNNINNSTGFTLLELLVVVLIIAILASIVLPQYKKIIERTKMAEAIVNLKAIASAQERYYLLHGKYLSCTEFDSLDIDIQGTQCRYLAYCVCRQSNHFQYMTNSTDGKYIAFAQRLPSYKYYIGILTQNKKIFCGYTGSLNYQPNKIQKELCDKINEKGYL